MRIGGRDIGANISPYIIAELSGNHGGHLENAIKLIDAAVTAGACAVKIQSFTPDTITLNCDKPEFVVQDGLWKGKRLYDLYKKTHTPFEWHAQLFEYARKRNITLFASVFDNSSIDLLETLKCPAYKIASFEVTDIPLISYAASKGKPMIISTGMASAHEIREAMDAAWNVQKAILHCVSGYPTPVSEYNLNRITGLKNFCGCPVGVSDHTVDIEIPIAATVLGANIVEKHIKLDFAEVTEDSPFSLYPDEFQRMVGAVRCTWLAMQHTVPESEEASRPYRRSLYAVKDIMTGEMFSPDNIRSIRPGFGLPPKMLTELIGRRAMRPIPRGTPLQLNMIGEPNVRRDAEANRGNQKQE